ncbi:MAG: hypothetical protein A3K19_07715 [Lentisphaerae bacterium RIFOXYB12_FULL_65_16]|nr:MAG: hypothetical protein A3K18_07430 [Lentisphaerae bacterium RIFOXYA12_64_32]OGV87535.1 MAG: hypothetical protein A3K19_07715 [Lentisphaerae bacterium RIFOXYB12_FULL_65_16]
MDRRRLAREIGCEIEQLRGGAVLAATLAAVPHSERRPWDPQAAAKIVADLAGGFENLCRRRWKFLGIQQPQGPDWHKRMLEDFLSTEGLGDQLSAALADRLRKYLSFRHRFVHGYGTEVSWATVEEPLRLLPETVEILASVWTGWLQRP